MFKKIILSTALMGVFSSVALLSSASAQTYPNKQIKFVVPFTAGSSTDIMARAVAERMGAATGQTVLVENKPGAGGTIAAAQVAKADADGYTVLVHSGSHAINPAIYTNLSYDTIKDFTNVAGLGSVPNIIIAPPGRYKNAADMVAVIKAKPANSFNYGSAGVGSATHLSAEKFMLSAGMEVQHIPYKGTPEVVTEVAAGRLEFYFAPVNAALPLIKDGRVQALASSGLKRTPALPDLPTTLEAGYADSDFSLWVGAFLPSKTPAEIAKRLHELIMAAVATPEVRERFSKTGTEAFTMNQAEFDKFVKKEIDVSAKIAKRAKMTVQ